VTAAAGPYSLPAPATSNGDDHLASGRPEPAGGSSSISDTPQLLLAHHLEALRLPTFPGESYEVTRQCAAEAVYYSHYLLRLAKMEMIDRERHTIEHRIKSRSSRRSRASTSPTSLRSTRPWYSS
jgi:hypothetical protein